MQNHPEFKVFVKPGCPWCVKAIDYLSQRGYRFSIVDVLGDADAFNEMKKISNQTKTPTMQVGAEGPILADFGVDELVPFLEKHGLT